MAGYTTKPVAVQAQQFDPKVLPWPDGVTAQYFVVTEGSQKIAVDPLDWIVAGALPGSVAEVLDTAEFDEKYEVV